MSTTADKLFPPPIPAAAALRRPAPSSTPHTPASTRPKRRQAWWGGLAAAVAWGMLGGLTYAWPNKEVGFSDWAYTTEFAWVALAIAVVLAAIGLAPALAGALLPRLRLAGPWLVASALGLALWELFTAKLGTLPTPFFAPPQSLAEVFISDWERLIDCAVNSIKLLLIGIGFGGGAGFVVGVLIGWSQQANYWIHPVLRVLGPLPTTALLPISFYFFPSSWSTAVFLIALGTAFPVAILTWSGVSSVHKNYYDVARTMGASPWFLVLRVAIPAALPQVFVGLFMGLGAAFSTLVVAEMLGVKSGLGWYLTWAQGWASYPNMYGALLVMALLFSGVISLLFLARDRVLSWQKGMVKW